MITEPCPRCGATLTYATETGPTITNNRKVRRESGWQKPKQELVLHDTWECLCGFGARRRRLAGEAVAPVVNWPVAMPYPEPRPIVNDVQFTTTWGTGRRAG